ncbi:MAG: aminotransferase class V-fold PLP-dependent enzyme [Thermoleophilia bacterium]
MIYLDNAATSYPKPEAVYRAIEDFAKASGGNPGRAGHRLAVEAEAMIDDTRRLAARLFGAPRPERIVFCLNATDALNMAIKGVVHAGDHVITSVLEHNSINRPLNRLERDGVITLTRLPATGDHLIDPDALAGAWTSRTRLVAVTHASNVTGTIQPVGAYGRITRERGGLLLVDAGQSAGVVPIDVEDDLIDLLAFTGHKGLLGPTGTGGLVVGERVEPAAWREGGTGGDSADPLQPAELPHHLEGGTPNVFGIAGLRQGLRILLERGVENVLGHERALLAAFLGALRRPELFSFYGADTVIVERGGEGRLGLLSFTMTGFAPDELAALLDQRFEIAVRPGLDCAPYAHKHLGTFPAGATRLSVGFLSTEDDVLAAAAALNEVAGG